MPAIGGGGGGLPQLPTPKPAPQPASFLGGIGSAVGGAVRAVAQVGKQASYRPPKGGGSDIVSSGPAYGLVQANAYKESPQYAKAVQDVFKMQSRGRQTAIVRNLVGKDLPETRAIGALINTNPVISEAAVTLPGIAPHMNWLEHLIGNAGKDVANLPSGTVQGLYALGKYLATGEKTDGKNGFQMLLDPYIQLAEHPGRTLSQHPINSLLLAAGPKALAGRLIGGAGRAASADWASTAREPLRLPDVAGHQGAPIEARSWSRDAITMAGQKAIAKARGENANIARPARLIPRQGAEPKIRRVANEMTAVRQMVGRTERGVAMKVLQKAAPHPAVRNIVSHILQGVVRTPETAVHDIHQEIGRLEPHAAQNIRKPSVAMARAQIKDLKRAAANPQHIPDAFKAAADIRAHLHASDAYLVRLGHLDPEQALRSRLMPYAQAHMGAHMDPGNGLSVGENPLATQTILDHLSAHGVPDPAYVGHYPGKVAPWRFYSAYRMARGTLGQKRTGEAFRVGGYDHTYNGLVAQGARTAEAITKAGLHDRIISRFGVTRPDGQDFTPAEARAAAYAAFHDENGVPKRGGIEYVPIPRAPHNALDHVRDLQNPHELTNRVNEAEIAAVDRAIRDAQNRTDSNRNVALVPRAAVEQFRNQFKQQGGISRELGRVTQQFRRTVLPYSTHWMFQIGTEAGLRGLLGGVLDPRNLVAGHQLMRSLQDTPEGRASLAEMVNAVFYNQHDTLGIHHDANPLVGAAKALPVSRQLISAHNHYADFVGHAMTRFEHEFRLMGLGKLARQQIQEFTGSYQAGIRLQGQNLAVLAKELKTDPNLVAKFGRRIDDVFGKYNKFSPKTRAAVQSFAPFLPWYLNAAKFVLWNLPKNHPVSSSLLASLRQTINQDVKDGHSQPLDAFAADQLARLSPFGIGPAPTGKGASMAGTLLSKDAAGVILPQLEGSLYNLAGGNSFGEGPLKGPKGDVKPLSGTAVRSAIENLLEAFVPAARQARELREGTSSSYGTSNLLQPQGKGSVMGAGILGRLFNPLYSFEQAKKNAGGSGGGGVTSLLNSIGSGASGTDLKQSLGDGVSGADLGASLRP